MKRLSASMVQQVTSDIQSGVSLNVLSRRYNLAKSTLYYHYRQIKGRRYVLPNVTPRYTEREGEIVGIFAGDGSEYYNRKRGHLK